MINYKLLKKKSQFIIIKFDKDKFIIIKIWLRKMLKYKLLKRAFSSLQKFYKDNFEFLFIKDIGNITYLEDLG